MPLPSSRSRGSMLIVALGILTLLSVLAVTFVTLMRLEKSAATNYVDGVKAKLAAEAGLQRLVADAKKFAKEPPFDASGRLKPFVFGATGGKEMDVSKRVEEVNPLSPWDAYFYGRIGASYKGGADEYRVKLVDTSALFDLNFPMRRDVSDSGGGTGKPIRGQVLEKMLDALGMAIAAERASKNLDAWDPINGMDPRSHRKCVSFGSLSGSAAILAYRATLDGLRYSSKSQLQEIMEEASYNVLAEYVTAHGSVDEQAVVALTRSGTGPHSAVEIVQDGLRPVLNVNLAPKPVLVAAIAPLAGRRHTYLVNRTSQEMEAQDPDAKANYAKGGATDPDFATQQKEDTVYDVREGFIYVGPFGYNNANQIADWIIRQRPFRGTADFYARLQDEMLKPTRQQGAGALDSFMPRARLLGQSEGIDSPGVRIFKPQPGSERYDLTGIDAAPYFQTIVREAGYSILLANFNPSFVASTAVPNTASYLPVDKGSLLFPDEQGIQTASDGVTYPRQTFDFCYETRGVFEVTSLGQIRKAFSELVAQEKILTVVRLLGHMTQRSQFDFERNDRFYSLGSAPGLPRSACTSFPNPRRLFTSLTAPVDTPSDLASRAWGHVEIDVRSIFEDNPAGAEARFRGSFAKAGMGSPLLGSLFEWYEAGLGVKQEMALHAFLANRTDKVLTEADLADKFFNKARGQIVRYPRQGTWTVANGSSSLYNDGIHLSYRAARDNDYWFRAGAKLDATPDLDKQQGALPLALASGAAFTGAPDQGANGDHKEGNLWYRKGGCEFWYKPDFDWSYVDDTGNYQPFPIYCGYMFASRIYYNPGVKVQHWGDNIVDASITGVDDNGGADPRGTPTDGTQIYLFRNTEGQIRASRLFFRVVGKPNPTDPMSREELPNHFLDPDSTDAYGGQPGDAHDPAGQQYFRAGPLEPNATDQGGAIDVYRRGVERRNYAKLTTDAKQPMGYPWPPLEFAEYQEGNLTEPYLATEKYIRNARVDAYVPCQRMERWRAGEWHHLAVYWDDGAGGTPDTFLRIYIDGRKQSETKIVGEEKAMFCRLNEPPTDAQGLRHPRDHLQVGYIERRIAKTQEGLFKHQNTVNPGGSAVSTDAAKVTLFACGVIDDFITYDGESSPGDSIEVQRRFEPQATYAQHFDLTSRMPGGGKPLELARLEWTILLPGPFHGANSPVLAGSNSAVIDIAEPMTVKIRKAQPPGAAQGAITYDSMRDYGYGKLEAQNGGPGLVYPQSPKLGYEITLNATSYAAAGGTSGVGQLLHIDTPALEEVSVVYFLPTEETLLKERVVD